MSWVESVEHATHTVVTSISNKENSEYLTVSCASPCKLSLLVVAITHLKTLGRDQKQNSWLVGTFEKMQE
jgi:hypothetical protein